MEPPSRVEDTLCRAGVSCGLRGVRFLLWGTGELAHHGPSAASRNLDTHKYDKELGHVAAFWGFDVLRFCGLQFSGFVGLFEFSALRMNSGHRSPAPSPYPSP